MTCASTCTWRRPSGGIRAPGSGRPAAPSCWRCSAAPPSSRQPVGDGEQQRRVAGAERVRARRFQHPDRLAQLRDPGRGGRRCGGGEVGAAVPGGRGGPQRGVSSGAKVASTEAPTPVSGTAADCRSTTSARTSRTVSRTGCGTSRAPTSSGSAARRAPPGVTGPAATTSASPRGVRLPSPSSRSRASSRAPAAVASAVPGAAARGRAGRRGRRGLRPVDERGEGGLGRSAELVPAPCCSRAGDAGGGGGTPGPPVPHDDRAVGRRRPGSAAGR